MNNVDDKYKIYDIVSGFDNLKIKIELFKDKHGDKQTINSFEQDILDLKDPEMCYWFAKNIKGANIKSLEQVLIESKDPEYCYEFARDVKSANIKKLEQVVIESRAVYWCYSFAVNVKGSNKKALKQIIKNSEFNNHQSSVKEIKQMILTLKNNH